MGVKGTILIVGIAETMLASGCGIQPAPSCAIFFRSRFNDPIYASPRQVFRYESGVVFPCNFLTGKIPYGWTKNRAKPH
jgi:hypothetical protein